MIKLQDLLVDFLSLSMKIKSYENFIEWEKDLQRVQENPNDMHLINHIAKRVEISADNIKKQIKEYLLDCAFDKNPVAVLSKIANESSTHFVFIKMREDPWFCA